MGTFGNNFGNNWVYPHNLEEPSSIEARGRQTVLIQHRPVTYLVQNSISIGVASARITNTIFCQCCHLMEGRLRINLTLFRINSVRTRVKSISLGFLKISNSITIENKIKSTISNRFTNSVFIGTDIPEFIKKKLEKVRKISEIAKILDVLDDVDN